MPNDSMHTVVLVMSDDKEYKELLEHLEYTCLGECERLQDLDDEDDAAGV